MSKIGFLYPTRKSRLVWDIFELSIVPQVPTGAEGPNISEKDYWCYGNRKLPEGANIWKFCPLLFCSTKAVSSSTVYSSALISNDDT